MLMIIKTPKKILYALSRTLTLCEFRVEYKAIYYIIVSKRIHKQGFDHLSVDLVWLEHECSLYKHGSSLITEDTESALCLGVHTKTCVLLKQILNIHLK